MPVPSGYAVGGGGHGGQPSCWQKIKIGLMMDSNLVLNSESFSSSISKVIFYRVCGQFAELRSILFCSEELCFLHFFEHAAVNNMKKYVADVSNRKQEKWKLKAYL